MIRFGVTMAAATTPTSRWRCGWTAESCIPVWPADDLFHVSRCFVIVGRMTFTRWFITRRPWGTWTSGRGRFLSVKGPMIMDRSKGWGNLCHDSIRGFHQATLSVAGWDLSLFAVDSGCFFGSFSGPRIVQLESHGCRANGRQRNRFSRHPSKRLLLINEG